LLEVLAADRLGWVAAVEIEGDRSLSGRGAVRRRKRNDGSWRADGRRGLPGLAPGIFMPAAPKPGMHFQQEVAPGVAEDEATIVGTGAVETPFGTFEDTIRVREANPIDGDKGYKAYAKGVGLIVDGPLSLISFTG
jgi:hypothetical protein